MSFIKYYYSFDAKRSDECYWDKIFRDGKIPHDLLDALNKAKLDQSELEVLEKYDFENGSIEAVFPNDANGKEFFAVLEMYGLDTIDDLFYMADTDHWIDIYENQLKPELIKAKAEEMAEAFNWNLDDCIELIRDFFIGMKPIIKDLKNNSSADLVEYTSGYDLMPKYVADHLKDRAKLNYKYLEEIIRTN
jgi:hypothetical protein